MDRMTRSEEEMRRRQLEEEEEYEAFRLEEDRRRGISSPEPAMRRKAAAEEVPVRKRTRRRHREEGPPRVRRKVHPVIKGMGVLVLLAVLAVAGLLSWIGVRLRRVDSAALQSALEKSISESARNNAAMAGYTNIALFGVDSREQDLLGGDNRSDTIMIASIHPSSGEIRLVSVFRDTYLDVGDGFFTKCNAAYAYGGPEQALAMLDANLDLNITDFVTIGFEGLSDTIDALGGIELDLTEEEIGYMNSYMEDMYYELGIPYEEVEEPGLQTVSGIQATAYCRIRYTEGDDFKRAQRQRTVLSLTVDKLRSASPFTLMAVADKVMGETVTSLSSQEILSLLTVAGKCRIEEQSGFPESSQWVYGTIDGQSVVVPNTLESNVIWLHEFLFGEEDYEPSQQVLDRSEIIQNTPR